MFSLSSLEPKRKFITLWSKFKAIPCLNFWKQGEKRSGITYNFSPNIAHVTDWVANWLRRDASGDTRGGSLSIFLLYSSFLPLSIYLTISTESNSSSVLRAEHMISIEASEAAAISLGMNGRPRFDPTRGGKHMFCWFRLASYLLRGLGIPPAGGMGRWRDGKGGGVGGENELVFMCLLCPDINFKRTLAYCPVVDGESLKWFWRFRGAVVCIAGRKNIAAWGTVCERANRWTTIGEWIFNMSLQGCKAVCSHHKSCVSCYELNRLFGYLLFFITCKAVFHFLNLLGNVNSLSTTPLCSASGFVLSPPMFQWITTMDFIT